MSLGFPLKRQKQKSVQLKGEVKPKISIAQPKPENQMAQLIRYVKKAHSDNVDLILFPEGYLPSYVTQDTLSLKDEVIKSIKRLTTEYDITIATGIKEKLGNRRYLSLVLFSEGAIVAIHRKVILTEFERKFFNSGKLRFEARDIFPVVKIPRVGSVGCLPLYENLFPETQRLLRYRGAEIVLAPSGIGAEGKEFDYRSKWFCMLRSRSIENMTYVVSATNAIGHGLMGIVIAPTGKVLMYHDAAGYKSCSIDPVYLRELRRGSFMKEEIEREMLMINVDQVPPLLCKMLYSECKFFKKRGILGE